jgi:uncharacterized protein (TIGR00369 family)
MSTDDEAFNQWWVDAWSGYETDITFTLGIEPVSAKDDYVELAMPFRPEIAQATGFFSAGALIQLADNAATVLCSRTAASRGQDGFPYTVQMSAQLVANTNSGRAIANATLISAGRSVMAAETRVTDESGKVLLLLTSTHVVRSMTPKGK